MANSFQKSLDDSKKIRNIIIRYLNFWPYFLCICIFLILAAHIYLRYVNYTYKIESVIQIIDESQNNEMALPTELTVFNRSMINLENEINILNSFSLHSEAVMKSKFNVQYVNVGKIKSSITPPENWINDYELDFKIDTNKINSLVEYYITTDNNSITINELISEKDLTKTYTFSSLTTTKKNHSLPFDLTINEDDGEFEERIIKIFPVEEIVNQMRKQISVNALGRDSDQLSIELIYDNIDLAKKYLKELLKAFDNDGIEDRQLEYLNTIKFVNEREKILKDELELIELKKQNFKQSNNLSDLDLDAGNNINLKYSYNSELFQAESQKKIAEYLLESVGGQNYDYLPINIGLENFDLNQIIINYNKVVTDRNKYLSESGPNNFLVKSINSQLNGLIENIRVSIQNYLNSVELQIENLRTKEFEFQSTYRKVPENEKTLRSIERELTIKEALYLLLLQKREEASINLAVVRPTIKIIDNPIHDLNSVMPNPSLVYIYALAVSLILYISILYIWFFFDNKIHNKEQLQEKLSDGISIIGEIPFISKDESINKICNSLSRTPLAESLRLILANLKFSLINKSNNKTILVTSTIKGEGKTLVSVNLASLLSAKSKVILIGADLRNPQIHKKINITKDNRGLSDMLFKKDILNYRDYIIKNENLDIILSGSIPPNPTEFLSDINFKKFLENLTKEYEYIIIDSAPCLLVSDTFEISDSVDSVLYLFRANHTESKLCNYINDIYKSGKFKNIQVLVNSVGNSQVYGYKYNYQYGYQYGYNYGYGYGYGEDNES